MKKANNHTLANLFKKYGNTLEEHLRDNLYEFHDMECCGVKELDGIRNYNTAEEALLAVCLTMAGGDFHTRLHVTNFAHLIFTQAGKRSTYGHELAEFITERRLGTVVASAPQTNPNTRNVVTTFVWTPDKRRLRAYWRSQIKALHKVTEQTEYSDNPYARGIRWS